MGAGPLLEHVVPFTLVLARMSGLFLLAPIVGSLAIPVRAKALLAVALAAAVYPSTSVVIQTPPTLDLFGLAPVVALELLIGFVIGSLASLPLMALQMAGHMMGYQMGLALAQAYNPELDAQTEIMGQVLFFMGIGIFMAFGGVEVMYSALANTFHAVPLGGFEPGATPLNLLVATLSSGFALAVRISAPVVGAVMLVLVSMGFIMKTMPQINVLSVGFAIKIICGLGISIAGLTVIADVAAEEIHRVLELVASWPETLVPRETA
jgi:flagellar biosynthetic protein FliR